MHELDFRGLKDPDLLVFIESTSILEKELKKKKDEASRQ